jgi:hypothetical protein
MNRVIEFPGRRQPRRDLPDRTIPAVVTLIAEHLVDTVAAALEAEGVEFETRERVTRRLLLTEHEREAQA